MLVRNQDIKAAPQHWSRLSSAAMAALDLVICSEQRVFDKVTEGTPGWRVTQQMQTHTDRASCRLLSLSLAAHNHLRSEEIGGRVVVSSSPVHVINLETVDDDASAKANAARALQLCKLVSTKCTGVYKGVTAVSQARG